MRRLALVLLLVACQRDSENNTPKTTTIGLEKKPTIPQIKPKLDPKTPPADATKTSSGLVYKKLVDNPSGKAPLRNDKVLINYTGWKSSDGSTFFTNENMGQPMPLDLSTTSAGFAEAMQLVKQGERVMLWIPPDIGYATPPQGKPEMLAYEVEVVGIEPAPPVPADLKEAPPAAKSLKSGGKLLVLDAGAEKPRSIDDVTFDYTAWDPTGRMFDSTVMRKRPATLPPFKQSAVMEEALTSLGKGGRARLWVDSDKLQVGNKTQNLPAGQLCYDLAVVDFKKAAGVPPAAPADVKAPPAGAKKSPKGVSYVVLKPGKSDKKPAVTDRVQLIYTGWTTDGRMVDSSLLTGHPATLGVVGTIQGWQDTLPLMSVGEKVRMWVPDELAYKGTIGKPQGMLVYDVELVEIAPKADEHAHGEHGQEKPQKPAPPDVAAVPKDAKKTASGLAYKVLKAKKGGAHPKASDTVKVAYAGWKTDGTMFDSSDSIEFSLKRVIAGWTEGLQLMGVGEKYRFWIPEDLAYKGAEPSGMLVFDIELFDVKASP
jgi:peptidylprolyl isomerase